jgi:hypothetical protein
MDDQVCTWCTRLAQCIRPIVTMGFALTFVYLAVRGQLSGDFIQGVLLGPITYWYAERATLSNPDKPH